MNEKLIFIIMFSGIWILIGTIFLIIGIVMFNNNKKKKISCTAMTYGKVIDIVKHQSPDSDGEIRYGTATWYPVIEYNIGELKFTRELPYGNVQARYPIGRDLEVYYNPENYDEYYIGEENLPKTAAKVFTIVGICSVVIALISAILVMVVM